MPEPIITEHKPETAILIGIREQYQDADEVEDYLRELAFLTETAGAVPGKTFMQRLDVPDPRTFVGSGKLGEIREYVAQNEIDLVQTLGSKTK